MILQNYDNCHVRIIHENSAKVFMNLVFLKNKSICILQSCYSQNKTHDFSHLICPSDFSHLFSTKMFISRKRALRVGNCMLEVGANSACNDLPSLSESWA